jgi:hypothetical protein
VDDQHDVLPAAISSNPSPTQAGTPGVRQSGIVSLLLFLLFIIIQAIFIQV